MSDIKFWIPSIKTYEDGFQHPTMTEIKGDGFISFNDYTKLKTQVEFLIHLQVETILERNEAEAEVKRLRAFATCTIIPNKELQAQIKRLTKAGDAIYESFDQFGQVDAMTLKGWQAAKDGKDIQ